MSHYHYLKLGFILRPQNKRLEKNAKEKKSLFSPRVNVMTDLVAFNSNN